MSKRRPKVTLSAKKAAELQEERMVGTDIETVESEASANHKKKMFRWNTARDAALLLEAEDKKPYLETGSKSVEKWTIITDEINLTYNGNVTYLGAKNRFNLLLMDFRKEDFLNRYKSGTEEEKTFIKDKLQSISAEIDEFKEEIRSQCSENSRKVDDDKAIANEIRGAAFENLSKDEIPSGSEKQKKKRLSDNSLAEMWYEKQLQDKAQLDRKIEREDKRQSELLSENEKERELRRKELELKDKSLDIQAAQLKLQQERFDLEKEERIQSQKMMMELIKKVTGAS